MKKFLFVLATSPVYLALTTPSFAQANDKSLDPCKGSTTGTLLGAACAGQGKSLGQIIGFVVTIAFVIAVLVALLFLVWGGVKWITSGGDKAGVETARNQIIAAIIGLIIVFLAFFILNLILGLFGLSLFNLELPTLIK
jgi:ABC-type amino acid transport system permease subunit